jgi:methylamine--corrinoid protein Co-methyltransferase
VASSKGVVQDRTTGMESRMMGEVANATVKYTIPEINRILDSIVGLYERDFSHAPAGKRFQDCYDVGKIVPTDDYINVYNKAVRTLERCGLDLSLSSTLDSEIYRI